MTKDGQLERREGVRVRNWRGIDAVVRCALVLLWTLSLCLPVWRTVHDTGWMMGWLVLLMGWMGPLALQFGWFANLLLLAYALLPASGLVGAFIYTILLAITVISSTFFKWLPVDSGDSHIVAWGAGYYVWMSVMVATAAYSLLRVFVLGDLIQLDERSPGI